MDDSFEEMRQRRKYRESESSRQGDNESVGLFNNKNEPWQIYGSLKIILENLEIKFFF